MGLQLPNQHSANCFFVTTSFDQHHRLGDVPGFYETLADSITFCLDKYHALLTGYVFMPTHIHLLLVIDGEHLGSFMRDMKKYIAQKAAPDLGVLDLPLWQSRYDRVAIFSDDIYRTKLEYIHNNPVKSGLTGRAPDWRWSSAGDYLTDKTGPIAIYKEWAC